MGYNSFPSFIAGQSRERGRVEVEGRKKLTAGLWRARHSFLVRSVSSHLFYALVSVRGM